MIGSQALIYRLAEQGLFPVITSGLTSRDEFGNCMDIYMEETWGCDPQLQGSYSLDRGKNSLKKWKKTHENASCQCWRSSLRLHLLNGFFLKLEKVISRRYRELTLSGLGRFDTEAFVDWPFFLLHLKQWCENEYHHKSWFSLLSFLAGK